MFLVLITIQVNTNVVDDDALASNEKGEHVENDFEGPCSSFNKQSSLRRKERLKKIVAKLRWQKCINAAQAFARFGHVSTTDNRSSCSDQVELRHYTTPVM